jgi:hypothetical protein
LTKKSDFSDAELLSFALKDVKPLPGRVIRATKGEIKQSTNTIEPPTEKRAYRDLSNKELKKQPILPPLYTARHLGLIRNQQDE